MLLVLLCFVVQDSMAQFQADTSNCLMGDFIGKLCSNKIYEPEDIISKESYRPIDIHFVSMTTDMYLSIPINYNTSSVKYKGFIISDSCVKNIEGNYFQNLDNNQKVLTMIKFNKVRCLQSLQTKSFNGIGNSVVKLQFMMMPDLIVIEEDFFNIFTSLKMLTITNTNVSFIPDTFFKVLTNINSVTLNNNKLTKLPVIPQENKALLENVQAYGNPFHCICSLMEFINIMTTEMKSQDYRCSSPLSLNGKPLTEIGNLCFIATSTTSSIAKNIKNTESVSMGYVKLEIIIGLSVLLLVIVIIIFIIIICKKRKRKRDESPVYNNGSPSKIVIFPNEECAEPFFLKNQVL